MNKDAARQMIEQEFPEYPAAAEIIRPNYAPEIRLLDPEVRVLLQDSFARLDAAADRAAVAVQRLAAAIG